MHKTLLTLTLLLIVLSSLTACQTLPRVNHVQRLLQHPEFRTAAKSAPKFTADALHTINDLQREINRLENQ